MRQTTSLRHACPRGPAMLRSRRPSDPGAPVKAQALDQLCDTAYENCRTPLLNLIKNETVAIDVGMWFMEDGRFSAELVKRKQAGVPIRILMDPRSNIQHPAQPAILDQLAGAGIPMRNRTAKGIEHWKIMIFEGQGVLYFGSANFSADGFVTSTPYVNYVDEQIYFTDNVSLLQTFQTRFDDAWTNTRDYADYANVTLPLTRRYPTYAIDPEVNIPPGEDFINRTVARINAEHQRIDVMMYRIDDERATSALISAHNRGVPIRLVVASDMYHDVTRPTISVPLRSVVRRRHPDEVHGPRRHQPREAVDVPGPGDDHLRIVELDDAVGELAAREQPVHDEGLHLRLLPDLLQPPLGQLESGRRDGDRPLRRAAAGQGGRQPADGHGDRRQHDQRPAEVERRALGPGLRHLFRHVAQSPALRRQPVPRSDERQHADAVVPAADAGPRRNLLLEDRQPDRGEHDPHQQRVELYDRAGAAAAAARGIDDRDPHRRRAGGRHPRRLGADARRHGGGWIRAAEPRSRARQDRPGKGVAGELLRRLVRRSCRRAVSPLDPHAGAGELRVQRLDPRPVQRLDQRRRRRGRAHRYDELVRTGAGGRTRRRRAQRLGMDRQRLGRARSARRFRHQRDARAADPAARRRHADRSDRPQPRYLCDGAAGASRSRRHHPSGHERQRTATAARGHDHRAVDGEPRRQRHARRLDADRRCLGGRRLRAAESGSGEGQDRAGDSPRPQTTSRLRSTPRPACGITCGCACARRTIRCRTIRCTCSSATASIQSAIRARASAPPSPGSRCCRKARPAWRPTSGDGPTTGGARSGSTSTSRTPARTSSASSSARTARSSTRSCSVPTRT